MEELTADQIFGKRVREARASAKVNQAELAERVSKLLAEHVGRGKIIDLEKGRGSVSLREAFAIAQVLAVAPINLLVPLRDEGGALLSVGAGLLPLPPAVARRWILGENLPWIDPLDTAAWVRFWRDEANEQQREERDELLEQYRRVWTSSAYQAGEIPLEKFKGFPAPLLALLQSEAEKEEQ